MNQHSVRMIAVAALLAGLLSACVQTNTVMVDQRTAIISTKVQKTGTPWDVLAPGDNASVLKTTLKEAAAITKKNGFRYFELLDARDRTRLATYTRSGSTMCNGSVMNNPVPGAPDRLSANCISSAPGSTTVVEPAIDILVQMYAEGEIDPKKPGLFDADWVIAQE